MTNDVCDLLFNIARYWKPVDWELMRRGDPEQYVRMIHNGALFKKLLMHADVDRSDAEVNNLMTVIEEALLDYNRLNKKWLPTTKFFLYRTPEPSYIEAVQAATRNLADSGLRFVRLMHPALEGYYVCACC